MTDEDYMKLALRLARRGWGWTSPNPMVGAVIVRDGRIIGTGYHRRFGGDHAEIEAIRDAGGATEGATIYVTLEPCSHHGKTPPCVDALLRGAFKRVVIAALDPNPAVNGQGAEKLRQNGVAVTAGVLEAESRRLNEAHFKFMSTGLPLVTLKYAQTLDGRIAAATGRSRWLTSEPFQRYTHHLRAGHDAILVGAGTVLADDPLLTVRLVRGRSPRRIVLDSSLRIPPESRVLTDRQAPTLVVTTARADAGKLQDLRAAGVEVLVARENERGEVDLAGLLPVLGQRGVTSVMVEGGGRVITAILRQRLADRLVIGMAPRIMGRGIEAVGDLGVTDVSQSLPLAFEKVARLGPDLVIEARPVRP
ncbi:MAG: bifunctional diaminohydroxyphosphoribosylaminopyrimidine deaminase/5-amino-6-(5-phosphoribosylamino)uracil reductase RibD [Chloroflexi bacterium]|nr:bifunctional diaminohydroxyphosphoribosylaminopyrimidine deaminase/5-amino-6-(5-phosphoribosylamino)uracil reductase RibD [Chloroflexota bacterium]